MALAELYTLILSTYLFLLTLHIRYNNPANSTNIKLGGHFGRLSNHAILLEESPATTAIMRIYESFDGM